MRQRAISASISSVVRGIASESTRQPVSVISRSSDKQLPRIDSHALVFENGKNFVVTVDADGKLAVKEVEVYRQLSKECYLSSGVQEGDRILNKNVLLVYNALNAD